MEKKKRVKTSKKASKPEPVSDAVLKRRKAGMEHYEKIKNTPEYRDSKRKTSATFYAKHKDDAEYKAMKAKNMREWLQKHKHDAEYKEKKKIRNKRYYDKKRAMNVSPVKVEAPK